MGENTGREPGLDCIDSGSGTPVVLLHGLGSSARDWETQLPAFSHRHRVLVPDLPGHGGAQPLESHSVQRYAEAVAATLGRRLDEPAHVVGLSLGGMVALQLALDYPIRVRSLVVVNCTADMRPRRLSDRLQIALRKSLLRGLGLKAVAHMLAPRLLPGDGFAARRRVFIERWTDNDPVQYRRALDAALAWHVDNRLHEIEVPVLVLAASDDYTPVAAKRALVDALPDGELVVVDDSRHALPVEHPARFNRIVLDFLARVDERSRRCVPA